jgi:hypothetical protein
MGLFDDYVDPQQFNSGGGLLGRLLALQQLQGQYQPEASFDQPSATPQTPSPASAPSPLLPGYGQPQDYGQSAARQPNSAATGGAYDPTGSVSSPPSQNTVLAQYSPARPVGIPLPPVFVPGTPENDAFVHSAIGAGRAIGGLGALILNNDNANRPPPRSRPIDETDWSGDHTEIKRAVGAQGNDDVRISPTGEVWAKKPDGSWENHGPADTFTGSGKPSGRRGKDRDR